MSDTALAKLANILEMVAAVREGCSGSIASSSQCCEDAAAGMSELEISDAIETSREQGWSELKDSAYDGAAALSCHAHNALVWEELKKSNPILFRDNHMYGFKLKLGRLIAEGGQARIYEASVSSYSGECVAKVYKMEGLLLADLHRQFPRATKKPRQYDPLVRYGQSLIGTVSVVGTILGGVVFGERIQYTGLIHTATLLEDGRLAFVMKRYWGDLRTLINLKLKDNNSQRPPFSPCKALGIIFDIAGGLKALHASAWNHL